VQASHAKFHSTEAPQLIKWRSKGAYGEAEFIFASIKVLTITGMAILPAHSHVIRMLRNT
jgi:L-asparagine transporter-like permease